MKLGRPAVRRISPATSCAALLLLSLLVGGLRAESIDYGADEFLASTRINVRALNQRPVAMVEILAIIEQQTPLQFVYAANRIPIQGRLVLDTPEVVSLDQLFTRVSAIAEVVFVRHNLKVVVRGRLPDDAAVPPPAAGP